MVLVPTADSTAAATASACRGQGRVLGCGQRRPCRVHLCQGQFLNGSVICWLCFLHLTGSFVCLCVFVYVHLSYPFSVEPRMVEVPARGSATITVTFSGSCGSHGKAVTAASGAGVAGGESAPPAAPSVQRNSSDGDKLGAGFLSSLAEGRTKKEDDDSKPAPEPKGPEADTMAFIQARMSVPSPRAQ